MQISPQDNKQVFDDTSEWRVEFAFFDGNYQDQGYALISINENIDAFTLNQDNAYFYSLDWKLNFMIRTLHLNQAALKVESGYDFEASSTSGIWS